MVVLNSAKCVVRRFALLIFVLGLVCADDPYRLFDWTVSYGDIWPLGVRQRGILINGLFPGPNIYAVTNDNLIINVHNNLPEPFLISWSGLQNRKNSFVDGVSGTTCAIPPGQNYTYKLQAKDQIGTYYYFPSTAFHKAAGGFGAIKILSRPLIPVPFPPPAEDYSILIGDWYKSDHQKLKGTLDGGHKLPPPDGILINGRGTPSNIAVFTIEQGKTIRLRITNVGLQNSLNFRIQGHTMKLVEVEGIHTLQTIYDSLDVHVGQSYSVLVTGDQAPQDYYIAVSTRFTDKALNTTAILSYTNSARKASGPIPDAPTANDIDWSLNQARSIRNNKTASGPRPNPQGSYPYWNITISRTIILESSAAQVNGKQRYAINSVSYVPSDTPLKLADYYKIGGVFRVNSLPDNPTHEPMYLDTAVLSADYKAFVEIVFQNHEDIIQSYHINGYNFRVVGMDKGEWSTDSRKQYNMVDALPRYTTQVYPKSWTAVLVALDNLGMWNVRSEFWARQYLGQQFYLRVFGNVNSTRDEYRIPPNALKCGRAIGLK
ncbi:Copper-resistance protein [Parasponia andersonii]|uniref:Copper-resistance protein n=1 Tax=Parasponia andersonii TaxID=3476 RepID=A0A2P5AAU7_PARAD|nr:Copper-resistance protein [Parasponia andersonii]